MRPIALFFGLFVGFVGSSPVWSQTLTIDGPDQTEPGSLCVFTFSGDGPAEWFILPEVPFHTDHDGRAVVMAPEQATTYFIIAAVIAESPDGGTDAKSVRGETLEETSEEILETSTLIPQILIHRCRCESSHEAPQPTPQPTPPQPTPPQSLSEWVTNHLPQELVSESARLAIVYENVANSIETGEIQGRAAAFATIRSESLAIVTMERWKPFLDSLSIRLYQERQSNAALSSLADQFRAIAEGFRSESLRPTSSALGATIPGTSVVIPNRSIFFNGAGRTPCESGRCGVGVRWNGGY